MSKGGEACVACWLLKRIGRSLGPGKPNPDVPMTLINHMSSHISSRFVKGRQVTRAIRCCPEAGGALSMDASWRPVRVTANCTRRWHAHTWLRDASRATG